MTTRHIQTDVHKGIANTRQKKTKKIHKRSTALERSVKYFTGWLKPASWRQPRPSFWKLAVDASDFGAGSVLLQEDDNGVDHPVCYYSVKFNKHQRNYSTIEKECLSLILALQHFKVYLASSVARIVIFTDHNPLIFIHKMKNKNQHLLRCSLMLQEHNLDITHIKGKYNTIPDALSRA